MKLELLDASAFAGAWPFTDAPRSSLAEVLQNLGALGLAGALLTPAAAVLEPEPMAANSRLLAGIRERGGAALEVFAAPVLNPSLPGWRAHLDECVELGEGAVRAVKLFPNYHGYELAGTGVTALAGELLARGLALCVQLRMSDERSHHPLMRVPGVELAAVDELAARHPALPVLACGAYVHELKKLEGAANLHLELSFLESGWLLRDAIGALGPERVLFGTHAPFHTPAAGVAKLESDELAPAVARAIAGGNLRRILDLAASSARRR